jgi:hypothetical protein
MDCVSKLLAIAKKLSDAGMLRCGRICLRRLCDAKTVPHFATVGQTYGPTKQNAGNRVSIEQRLSMSDRLENNGKGSLWPLAALLIA